MPQRHKNMSTILCIYALCFWDAPNIYVNDDVFPFN